MTVHNLPAQSTPFIGRADEIADLTCLLEDAACHLLTLVGPGGSGKTRLALQVAAQKVDDFPNGIYFVPLAPLISPENLVPAIGNVLGIYFDAQQSPEQQLLTYLSQKNLLLILDNFEHLLAGAALVAEMLATSPALKILVTSREALNLQEEWVRPVTGMHRPLDDREGGIEDYSAVQLFVECARRVRGDFDLEAEKAPLIRTLQLVEGMPLGIELAAAWLKTLGCAQIADEIQRNLDFLVTPLRNVPERQRSMRAVFEHSWRLLTAEEQVAFRRLAVFRGGFEREAAEQIANASLHTLAALVDKSLLHKTGAGNYDIHELLRQYVHAKLSEAGEVEEMQTRHLDYFAKWVENIEPKLRGAEQIAWLDRLDAAHDNLRAALALSLEGTAEARLRLAGALTLFWYIRGFFAEGHTWLEAILADIKSAPDASMAKALYGKGALAWARGDDEWAIVALEKSVAMCRELGDKWGLATSLGLLGLVIKYRDYKRAITLCQEARHLFQELGDKWGLALVTYYLGEIALHVRREYDQAVELHQEGLRLFREVGDQWGIAHVLLSLAEVPRLQKHVSHATALLEESLNLFRSLKDRWYVAWTLYVLADVERSEGDYLRATVLIKESVALWRDVGSTRFVFYCLAALGGIAGLQGKPEQAARLFGALAAYFRAIVDVRPTAYTEEDFDGAALTQGEEPPPIPPNAHSGSGQYDAAAVTTYDNDVAAVRAQLGEAAFDLAWAAGQAMTLEQAIAYALQDESIQLPQEPHQPLAEPLSQRELDVLRQVAEGLSNAEIGQKLYLSTGTVKVHVRNIFGKLGVGSRTQAVAQAQKLNLL